MWVPTSIPWVKVPQATQVLSNSIFLGVVFLVQVAQLLG